MDCVLNVNITNLKKPAEGFFGRFFCGRGYKNGEIVEGVWTGG